MLEGVQIQCGELQIACRGFGNAIEFTTMKEHAQAALALVHGGLAHAA